MMVIIRRLIVALLSFSCLRAEVYYEGTSTFRVHGKVDLQWMVQFLPYNPIIVDVGAYEGEQTLYAAKVWPQGRIFAFEPNPRAFEVLHKTVEGLDKIKIFNAALNCYNGMATLHLCRGPLGNDPKYEDESSLLSSSKEMEVKYKGPKIGVPCMVLDDWCKENQIDHIDILRLELEGLELQVLQSSPDILKTAKIIIVSSFFYPYRTGTVNYFDLKDFLTASHFVPLAHWYTHRERGLAVYVSQELFDAYFVRSLGLGSGGIVEP